MITKQLLLFILLAVSGLSVKSQNVGIGTTTPQNQLQIGNPPGFSGNHFAIGNGTQGMSLFQAPGSSIWYSNTNFALMPNTGNGYVGIGTTTPAYKLTVNPGLNNWGMLHTDGTITLGSYINSTSAFGEFGTRSNHPFYLFANNVDNPPAITIDKTGTYVGIGTTSPSTKLEVLTGDGSWGMIHTNGSVRVGTYAGSSGGWIATQSTSPLYFATSLGNVNGSAQMSLLTNGNLGIGTINPANKMQIGSVGSSGFGSNDIAFGNGTQASAIAQTAGTAWWYSNTNISLMPSSGSGRVGINTITPRAPLEVDGYASLSGDGLNPQNKIDYFKPDPANSYNPIVNSCQFCSANVSIYASNNVMALEMDVVSDARIKDVDDISNSSTDLETLNKIQVTDYTMKDKVEYGNKPFKKIIAQQVEKVYPQVVNRNVNYIPNVYQLTNKIEKKGNGYLLSFATNHNLDKDARKLQLIDKNGTQQRYDIIAIPSDKEVVINASDLKSDTVFVYGEQVNDFRSVDYDGLTTLNISATQELSKLIKQQQVQIDAQNEKINLLVKEVEELKRKK